MKEMFEQVIQLGNYDLKTLLDRIDQYHIEGRLTDEERLDLIMQARKGAEPEYDYAGEINALWAAVRALQQNVLPPTEEDEWPEFVQPFVRCSRMSRRLRRTNGPNLSSLRRRAQRIRWATRSPSGEKSISAF